MPTYRYCLIQYVPHPLRGERVNVGVVVTGQEPTYFGARVVPKSARGRLSKLGFASSFGFLDDLHRELEASTIAEGQLATTPGPWSEAELTQAFIAWANTVQFTAMSPAIHARPKALLDALYAELVLDPSAHRTRARDGRWIRRRTLARLRQGLAVQGFDFDTHVLRDIQIQGSLERHTFDFQLRNGQPIAVLQGLALEGRNGREKEIEALAWSIDDVLKQGYGVPVTVLSVGAGPMLDRAERIYDGLGAQFVREPEIDAVIDRAASSLLAATTH